MRSYALLVLAVAVLHARAASIPAPQAEKKLPTENDALDDVSLDNSDSEQALIDPKPPVKDVENNLRNSIPVENVPVKVIEEQPVIKTIALKEDSNDYVPDNDDSINIKRVEIDLKNPGPPQRQEHDSQNPGYHVDKEKALATIKQSIAESEIIFKRGVQDLTEKFKSFFANTEQLSAVQDQIVNLKNNVNNEVSKLSDKIDSCFKTHGGEAEGGFEQLKKSSNIKKVENDLKTLKTNFKAGVDLLTEGVELLSILKEEDEAEKSLKISGKADSENTAAETSSGSAPANPAPAPTPVPPETINPLMEMLQNFQSSISQQFNNMASSVTSFFNPNQQQTQNQAQNTPAGTQSDDASTGTTEAPNLLQQFSNSVASTFQNVFNNGNNQQQQTQQQNTNPFLQPFQTGPLAFLNPWNQNNNNNAAAQTNQATSAAGSQPAADKPVAAPTAQGSNAVPAAPTPQADPPKPAKESQPVQNQAGPIQQILQNNPIVQSLANTVQRIQGLSNPSKPRDTPPPAAKPDSKGHGPGGHGPGGSGDNHDCHGSGVNTKSAPVKEEPQTIPEIINDKPEPVAELNKTE